MQRHLLFTSIPGHGHVNPTLPLVGECVRRGHRVTYVTNPSFREPVESAGATLLATTEEIPSVPSVADFTAEQIAERFDAAIANARESLPTTLARLRNDPVDAVCFDDMTLTGRILSKQLECPCVALVPTFASNENFSLRERLVPTTFDPENPAFQRAVQRMGDFAAEYGLDREISLLAGAPEPLNIVFLPRQFQLAADTFDDRFRFVGPSVGSRTSHATWQPEENAKPLLFISLGTVFNNQPEFFRMCINAFADSQWNVVMAIGENVDKTDIGSIPSNFEIRSHFPQPAVLQRADVFLSHAGMNSTMESLQAGVPLVTVPQMPEQETNASRVEELQLGRKLNPHDLSSELLRQTVDDVAFDDNIKANLEEMASLIQTAGGPVAAVDAIEHHLTNSSR